MDAEKTEIFVTFDVVAVYLEFKKPAAAVTAELFTLLKETGAGVDLISLTPLRRSVSALSFSVDNCDFSKVLKAAAQLKDESGPLRLEVSGGYAKITLHGNGLSKKDGMLAGFSHALRRAAPETILISASDLTLSVLVRMAELDRMLTEMEGDFPGAEITYLTGED
ncbi:MAG: hypothetical protein E7414_01330 [Ruminococcaceae bacterium]|nr:hypothetical protein [Oscillospiraceae bacterium]